ncbi:HD-GYP domain-containing protein [Salibacterium halotolerans]|uniref:HD-GYP domain, c-di-GMP phosphodiesterase class II (Or its inactivated variant) n=1 Tax=Salibacterium halotolerans TaxID=1884432 RepID=A0A1I5U7A7_9BACI|nr:HD-GYP domain-containing protein [Salibacterium halotolerans]SFP90496.1 HD-GYP domain, c-di-GMP phosphodiesterase class II (or its inactivated variant) [Salibacterium halotolerans]
MKVKPKYLKEGCILREDVFAVTSRPIIRKKTVLSHEHLNVLKAFMITHVFVENRLVDGTPFMPEEQEDDEEEMTQHPPETFLDVYLKAVQAYKSLFQKWAGGARVEMDKVRSLLASPAEKLFESPNQIFSLHHYSTKDDYLYHHAVSTALLSMFLAKRMGLSKKEWLQAGIAGAMCDAGMARIPGGILQNKGHLMEWEYEEVKNHPYYSYHMLKETKAVNTQILLSVLQHHEREDGSGYPLQMKTDNIHTLSKIVSTADVYHAMTSERYYRKKRSPYKVIDEMFREEFGRLDPYVLQLLTEALITFSLGSNVRLSDGDTATIIYIDEKSPAEPMVRSDTHQDIIQLQGNKGPFIEEILQN